MAKVLVTDTHLSDIADAIRTKNGTSTTYKPGEMAEAITNIQTNSGGGSGEKIIGGFFAEGETSMQIFCDYDFVGEGDYNFAVLFSDGSHDEGIVTVVYDSSRGTYGGDFIGSSGYSAMIIGTKLSAADAGITLSWLDNIGMMVLITATLAPVTATGFIIKKI